jgi:hypothetical protein
MVLSLAGIAELAKCYFKADAKIYAAVSRMHTVFTGWQDNGCDQIFPHVWGALPGAAAGRVSRPANSATLS